MRTTNNRNKLRVEYEYESNMNMIKKHQDEKILIDVIKDRFSSSETLMLKQCINEIEKNKKSRNIIWRRDTTGVNEKIVISV